MVLMDLSYKWRNRADDGGKAEILKKFKERKICGW
jgi:hypothetical protein